MNNEPVAWMETKDGKPKALAWVKEALIDAIPLYTQPAEHDLGVAEAIGFDKGYKAASAKELTDEEIYACFHQYFVLGEPKPTHYELEYEDLIEFANAILRKAQEK